MAANGREWARILPVMVAVVLRLAPCALGLAPFALCLAPRAFAERAEVQAAFTPGDNIAAMIVERIRAAQSNIRMQAYLFTDRRIANALVGALKRGVRVDIVADGTQQEGGGAPHLAALKRAGAHVFLTETAGAAHNKVLIIDADRPRSSVITGSYNYTVAANARNAENVVIISGSPAIARRFVDNFDYHRSLARAWP
jgi:phosphatidylserine/phosphatidylglycerophosphate/cardiolipin synthase-like enzyme